MEYVRLGASGLRVSRLALGAMGFGDRKWRSWVLPLDQARPVFHRALEAGINLIDTCDYYSNGVSEKIVGKLVAEAGARDRIVLATKAGNPMGEGPNARGFSRRHLVEACEASLRRVGTDRIDIYQTHIWDPHANLEEMMRAFHDLVRAGKVLYIGVTDLPFWQFAKAHLFARHCGLTPFASVQNHYNLLWREDERDLMAFCRDQGIGLIPYSPLARGFLLGRARRTDPTKTERAKTDDFTYKLYGRAADEAVTDAVAVVAARLGATAAQVALAWVLSRPGVTAPIFGPTRVEHIDEALGALTLKLSPEDMKALEAPYTPRPAAGHGL